MWDCAIVGGGPAGLTAATYLGRFKRQIVLIDAGESRLARVPLSRNVPGFPAGVAGRDLLARMQDQASRYGAVFRAGRIDRIKRAPTGFSLVMGEQRIAAKTVLLATGAKLVEPDVPNLDHALANGLIRYCPICDGYEAQGKNIATLGGRPGAIAEAHFLRTYSERVTYLWLGEGRPTDEERSIALAEGIRVSEAPLRELRIENTVEATMDGESERFDVLYPCLGCDPVNELAVGVSIDVTKQGGIRADAHQRTSVEGIYAAGDVLQGLDQIASACGQAAIAATAIHNDLKSRSQTAG